MTLSGGGTIELNGQPMKRVSVATKRSIGYVSQEQTYYPWMTPAQLGRFVAAFYPTWDRGEYARLLRVLETGVFARVGGETEVRSDVRVITATNREPIAAVHEGRLREDLMYRLAVFPIELPPLRLRGDDIELLSRHFVAELCKESGMRKELSDVALETLRRHSWPGNVRELRNVLQRAFILADGGL